MNLFFVHTPFQLIVAQSICVQYKLRDNCLILSHTGKSGEKFYKVFDDLIISDLWIKVEQLGDINVFSSIWSMYISFPEVLKKTNELIRKYKTDHIYMGDVNHPFYAFLTVKYFKSLKVSYFEEGLSHYSVQYPHFENTVSLKLKKWMLNVFLFRRHGVVNFSDYLYNRKNYNLESFVNNIFSIIPQYDRKGYVPLRIQTFLSTEFSSYVIELKKNISLNSAKKVILFLSTTANGLFEGTLDKVDFLLKSLDLMKIEDAIILIKFHPKENSSDRERFLSKIRSTKHIIVVLFNGASYPIEIIYGQVSIDAIIGFDSSSLLYARALNVCNHIYSITPLINAYNAENSIESEYSIAVSNRFQSAYLKLFGDSIPILEEFSNKII